MDLLLTVLNYLVRGMTIAVGLILIIKPFSAFADNADFVKTFGAVTVVFGVIRTVIYYRKRKEAIQEQQKENDENMENE